MANPPSSLWGRVAARFYRTPAPAAVAPIKPTNVFGNPAGGFHSPAAYGSMKSFRVPKPKERREAIVNARKLRAQLGIMKALGENTARHALGNGLQPGSLCQDKEWRPYALDYFHSIVGTKRFDIRGESDFFQLQKLVLTDVIFDSDAGVVPTRDRDGNPRLQLFPTEAIGDCGGASVFDGFGGRWEEGILRSEAGERLAYRILRERRPGAPGTFKPYFDYDARNFFYIGRTDRINGGRPMPWMYHGDQSALNILNLNNLQMAKERLNAYFVAAIKTRDGGLPFSLEDAMREEDISTTADTGEDAPTRAESQVAKAEKRIIDLFGQGALLPLEKDQEFQFFNNSSDSQSFRSFIEYLIADIATGFGVPWQFVWGLTGMAGPYTRLVLQQADWFFQDVQSMMITDFCQPVWEGVIEDGMNRGKLRLPKAGTNWRASQWQGPGSMTIDKGRDGKLYLDMVKSGMGRRSTWNRLTGLNGMPECFAAIDELKELMEYCDNQLVPREYYFGREFGTAGGYGAATQPGQPDPEEAATNIAEQVVEMMLSRGLVISGGKR